MSKKKALKTNTTFWAICQFVSVDVCVCVICGTFYYTPIFKPFKPFILRILTCLFGMCGLCGEFHIVCCHFLLLINTYKCLLISNAMWYVKIWKMHGFFIILEHWFACCNWEIKERKCFKTYRKLSWFIFSLKSTKYLYAEKG